MKKKLVGILYCAVKMLFGVLILFDHEVFTSGILRAIGIILAVVGIIGIIKYFTTPVEKASKEQLLTKGLLTTLLGIFAFFGTEWIIKDFPIILIFGFIMLVIGLSKIQLITDSIRKKEKRGGLELVSAAVAIICAVIVIFDPFGSANVLWILLGISIIADAIFDLVSLILIKKQELDEDKSDDDTPAEIKKIEK